MHRHKLQNNKNAQNQNQTPKKTRAVVMKQQFYSGFPLQAVSRPLQGHFGHSTGLERCSSSWQQGGHGAAPPGSCETTLSLVRNLTDLVHLFLQTTTPRWRAGSQSQALLAGSFRRRPATHRPKVSPHESLSESSKFISAPS